MSIKDPKINQITITGKVDSECESRQTGEHTVYKLSIRIWNLGYDKETKKKVFQPYPLEVKAWNKMGEKMSKLAMNELAVFSGSLEATMWENREGKTIPFLFLNAQRIENFEAEEKPAPKPKSPEQTEVEQGVSEDDIPF